MLIEFRMKNPIVNPVYTSSTAVEPVLNINLLGGPVVVAWRNPLPFWHLTRLLSPNIILAQVIPSCFNNSTEVNLLDT